MMDILPIVDVNRSNAARTWPLLLTAIDSADYISLDLVSASIDTGYILIKAHHFKELSGLGKMASKMYVHCV